MDPGGSMTVSVFAIDHHLVDGLRVSTLEVDFDDYDDVYETILFDGLWTLQEWRWEGRDEATLGHHAVVSWVRHGGPEP